VGREQVEVDCRRWFLQLSVVTSIRASYLPAICSATILVGSCLLDDSGHHHNSGTTSVDTFD